VIGEIQSENSKRTIKMWWVEENRSDVVLHLLRYTCSLGHGNNYRKHGDRRSSRALILRYRILYSKRYNYRCKELVTAVWSLFVASRKEGITLV